MPVMDGLEACKQLKKMDPTVKILILTVYPEKEYATRVLTSGALGYVTKKASPEELHRAVRSVADNTIYISQDSKDIILSKLLNLKGNPDFLDTLSDREMQVLRLLGQGKGIKDIASELCLSPKTIDNYRYRILNKLDLKRTVDLVLFANQHKLT
jgi:DNA-binding NarL/FixJ family response regulator